MRVLTGDAYFDIIVRQLAPLLGPNMARSATRGQCEKLGLPGKPRTPEDVERVLEGLAPGLRVFVGKEKSDTALGHIRREVRSPGGGS